MGGLGVVEVRDQRVTHVRIGDCVFQDEQGRGLGAVHVSSRSRVEVDVGHPIRPGLRTDDLSPGEEVLRRDGGLDLRVIGLLGEELVNLTVAITVRERVVYHLIRAMVPPPRNCSTRLR